MAREFREEDRNKPLIAPAGITVGTIGTVRRDRATVTRTEDHDSLTEEVKDLLGWDDADDEGDGDGDDGEPTREIRPEHVDRYEDDGIYLRSPD